jgi:hypothetical protein
MIKRNPSIHIKSLDLCKILNSYGIDITTVQDIIKCILTEYNNSVDYRRVIVKDIKVNSKTKGDRVKKPRKSNIDSNLYSFLNQYIYSIKLNQSQIPILQDNLVFNSTFFDKIYMICYEYCEYFKFSDYKLGFKEYVDESLVVCNNVYTHTTFIYSKSKVYERKQLQIKLGQLGISPVILENLKELWVNTNAQIFNKHIPIDILDDIEIKIHLALCWKECEDRNINLIKWLISQFKAWEYTGKCPPYNYIYGKKALENYYNHSVETPKSHPVSEYTLSEKEKIYSKFNLSKIVKDKIIT